MAKGFFDIKARQKADDLAVDIYDTTKPFLRHQLYSLTNQRLIPASLMKVMGVTVFVILTAAGAKVRFFLPYTPIPITLQVFFVLFSGAALGSRLGALSQTAYVTLGLIGLPIFAGEGGGWGYLKAYPTSGGYLVGFIAAAYITGAIIHRKETKLQRILFPFIGYAAGILVIYALGCAWLWLWANVLNELGWNITTVLEKGMLPFVIGDALKVLAAVPPLWIGRLIAQTLHSQ